MKAKDDAGAAGEEFGGAGAGSDDGGSGGRRNAAGGSPVGSSEADEGGTAGEGGAISIGDAGAAGEAPVCHDCTNGLACSATTCKTTCSADADCLADHFCSDGQCRLDAIQVSVGTSHACILLADKTVSCWGKNDRSQLGTASAADSGTPVQVKFLSNVQSIAAGDGITFALLTDGTVQFWGTRLTKFIAGGTSTTVASQYPTAFEGLSEVKQITTGGRGNGCATLVDGTARCWGSNDWGQLGDGGASYPHSVVLSSYQGSARLRR